MRPRWLVVGSLVFVVAAGFIRASLKAGSTIGEKAGSTIGATDRVRLVRVPHGGIQPQAVTDHRGVTHVVYFSGPPGGGDLYYTRFNGSFSEPLRVNSVVSSAVAMGTVRGGQLAVGRGGRVHVVWNGSQVAKTEHGMPLFYARLDDRGAAFEPQRDVITWAHGLDGGSAVAAGNGSRVVVAWHARGAQPGEEHRTVYVATSDDEGRRFAREKRAHDVAAGACACCGMRALIDRTGTLHLAYRAAGERVNRDTTWVAVGKDGHPHVRRLHRWKLESCPMSTFSLAEAASGIVGAWETEQQAFFAKLGTPSALPVPVGRPSRAGEPQKHSSLAISAAGEMLIAWAEGTGWARGGTVAWKLFDRGGREIAARADAGEVPKWSLAAAAARPDGTFVIFH